MLYFPCHAHLDYSIKLQLSIALQSLYVIASRLTLYHTIEWDNEYIRMNSIISMYIIVIWIYLLSMKHHADRNWQLAKYNYKLSSDRFVNDKSCLIALEGLRGVYLMWFNKNIYSKNSDHGIKVRVILACCIPTK